MLPLFRAKPNLLTAPPNKRTIRCVSPLRRAVFAKSTPAEARPRFRGQLFRVRYTFLVRCPNSQDGIVKLRPVHIGRVHGFRCRTAMLRAGNGFCAGAAITRSFF